MCKQVNIILCVCTYVYVCAYVCTEVERNLVACNTQTLEHWKLFNTLFPLTVAKSQLSQAENLMYRSDKYFVSALISCGTFQLKVFVFPWIPHIVYKTPLAFHIHAHCTTE